MAKIEVELNAFYGFGCGCQSYDSSDTIDVEVSENELEVLKSFGKEEITAEDIVAAINGGDTTLESLHDKLSEAFYNMAEEYWLYEADNEFLEESLREHIEDDIESGEYAPSISLEEFIKAAKEGKINFDGLEFGYFDEIDEDYDFDDEEDIEDKYNSYILNGYYDWIKKHDHEFVAERVGLDLDACRDDEVSYTINLSK